MKTYVLIPVSLLAGALGSACDLGSTGGSTGGVEPEAGAAGAGPGSDSFAGAAGMGAGQADARCPRGTTIVLSDFLATQIALSDLEGETLSESFLSTASSRSSGLAFALSGDVVVPSAAPASGRVVLLDRFGTNVITWLDPATAEVLGQLAVGTGFESNPADYLEIGETTALVSRYGQNASPGSSEHDSGGDLLIIDTDSYEIVGSIVFEPEDGLPPRPAGMARMNDEVVVALERVSSDWIQWGDARLVGVSVADVERSWTLELVGLKNCGAPVALPDGERWLVGCAGVMTFDGAEPDVDESALVILDASERPPREVERIPAEEIAGELIQSDVELASGSLVLLKTQTAFGGPTNNRWIAYDLESSKTTTLVEAEPDSEGKGKGLVYGGMVCSPGCSEVCLLADAGAGVLRRVRVHPDGELEPLAPVVVEEEVGLPPRGVAYR